VEPNVPLERVVNRLPVEVLTLVPSNETVHQNGNTEQIAPVAVSGATGLLEADLFSLFILVLFCFVCMVELLRVLTYLSQMNCCVN